MATAAANMMAFESALAMEDIEFTELAEAALPSVVLHFRTDCLSNVDVVFSFDATGNTIRCSSGAIATVPAQKRTVALQVLNEMNTTYRWFNFYLSADGEVLVQADAIMVEDHVGDMCMTYLANLLHIIDDAYPRLMKGFWSE